MIKQSFKKKDITFVNIYAPNIEGPKYIQQLWTHIREVNVNRIIIGDINTPITPMDR